MSIAIYTCNDVMDLHPNRYDEYIIRSLSDSESINPKVGYDEAYEPLLPQATGSEWLHIE